MFFSKKNHTSKTHSPPLPLPKAVSFNSHSPNPCRRDHNWHARLKPPLWHCDDILHSSLSSSRRISSLVRGRRTRVCSWPRCAGSLKVQLQVEPALGWKRLIRTSVSGKSWWDWMSTRITRSIPSFGGIQLRMSSEPIGSRRFPFVSCQHKDPCWVDGCLPWVLLLFVGPYFFKQPCHCWHWTLGSWRRLWTRRQDF